MLSEKTGCMVSEPEPLIVSETETSSAVTPINVVLHFVTFITGAETTVIFTSALVAWIECSQLRFTSSKKTFLFELFNIEISGAEALSESRRTGVIP